MPSLKNMRCTYSIVRFQMIVATALTKKYNATTSSFFMSRLHKVTSVKKFEKNLIVPVKRDNFVMLKFFLPLI